MRPAPPERRHDHRQERRREQQSLPGPARANRVVGRRREADPPEPLGVAADRVVDGDHPAPFREVEESTAECGAAIGGPVAVEVGEGLRDPEVLLVARVPGLDEALQIG